MKKRLCLLLCGLLLLIGALFVFAACHETHPNGDTSDTDGVIYRLSEDGTYAEVLDCSGSSERVIIADTYEGVPVKSIGSSAFKDCSTLISITIPDSVVSIGSFAFEYCDALTSVTIPDSVTSIDAFAFFSCDALTSVTIGDGVTSIGDCAFGSCSALTSIQVDENNPAYKSIDGNLYSKDGKFLIQYAAGKTDKSFTIPDSVTSIGDSAFDGCDALTSITIPDSVTSIGAGTFSGCSKLTSITVPDGVTSIGADAFSDCINLNYHTYGNAYYLGNESNPYILLVEAVNKNIESCDIHKDTKFVHSAAFRDSSALISITIPDSVTSLGDYAFYNCGALASVTIGDSVTSLDFSTFMYCGALTSIQVDENNPTYKSIDGNLYSKDGKTLIQYAIGKADTTFTVPDTVTSIDSLALVGCDALTSVTIGDGVTSIGSFAFRECFALTDVYYTGSEADWEKITIDHGNWKLTGATIHYNYVP